MMQPNTQEPSPLYMMYVNAVVGLSELEEKVYLSRFSAAVSNIFDGLPVDDSWAKKSLDGRDYQEILENLRELRGLIEPIIHEDEWDSSIY